jgi:hypothetical protein
MSYPPAETYPSSNPAETAATTRAETYPSWSLAENHAASSPAENHAASRPAENHAASIPAESSSPDTTKRLQSVGRLRWIWRRARLQVLAVLGAAVIGYTFGYIVAANDRPVQFFLSGTVGIGLTIVFSGLASQLRHKGRRRL